MCARVCFWLSACERARVHQGMYPSVRARVCEHVCVIALEVRECFLCVCVALEHSHPAEVTVKRWEQA